MIKAHTPINWENEPSYNTPINETNLNKMDSTIGVLDDRIIEQDTSKLDKTTAYTMLKDISFNENNGIFTVTRLNGSTFTIDTRLEKIAINFKYDYSTQKLIVTLVDGSTQSIDMSTLLTQYEFEESNTISWEVSEDGKVKANILDGSITENMLQPNYLAEIKLETEKSAQSMANAKQSELNAKASEESAAESAERAENAVESIGGKNVTIFDKKQMTGWENIYISDGGVTCYDICYGNGILVAVGENSMGYGVSYYSKDGGITWNIMDNYSEGFIPSGLLCVAYGNGRFIALGYGGICFYSDDGMTWVEGATTTSNFSDIAYGNGRFATCSTSGNWKYTVDGTSWSNNGGSCYEVQSITYGKGLFVAASSTATYALHYSYDGFNWSTYSGNGGNFYCVRFLNDKFIAVGASTIYYSEDGRNWNEGSGITATCKGVAYGNGLYVAVSSDSTTTFYSKDGITWSTTVDNVEITPLNQRLNRVAYADGNFISAFDGGVAMLGFAKEERDLNDVINELVNDEVKAEEVKYGDSDVAATLNELIDKLTWKTRVHEFTETGINISCPELLTANEVKIVVEPTTSTGKPYQYDFKILPKVEPTSGARIEGYSTGSANGICELGYNSSYGAIAINNLSLGGTVYKTGKVYISWR